MDQPNNDLMIINNFYMRVAEYLEAVYEKILAEKSFPLPDPGRYES